MPVLNETRCRVCNSTNRDYYEKIFYESGSKISCRRMSEMALDKGESISRKSFERHFRAHYTPERIQELVEKKVIDAQVEKAKEDAINILDEVKNNLIGLKALMGQAKYSKNVSDTVAVFKEVRMTLLEIERLRSKLSTSTSLTKADLYKEIFFACSILCSECREKFLVKLDERLKQKGYQ